MRGFTQIVYGKNNTPFSDDPDWTMAAWVVNVCVKCFSKKEVLKPASAFKGTIGPLNIIRNGKIVGAEAEKERFRL